MSAIARGTTEGDQSHKRSAPLERQDGLLDHTGHFDKLSHVARLFHSAASGSTKAD
jgi:hypothetical protein